MKIPLVGQSYGLRSPAAACQQTLNLIPQFIDDPDEQGKNKGILIGAPGYHKIGDVNALGGVTGHVFRGSWSGGGRLFVLTDDANGVPGGNSWLWEVALASYVGGNPSTGSGAVVTKQQLVGAASDGLPGQMFGNGNQLFIVKNGLAWWSQGSGPSIARFRISGTVNTSGTSVTWVSGDQFPPLMAGGVLFINGTAYSIASYISTTGLTLSSSAGTQSGATYAAPYGDPVTAVTGAYLDSYFLAQRPASQLRGTVSTNATTSVTWVAGDNFTRLVPYQQIAINGVSYEIATVNSSTSITLTGATASSGSVPYSATFQTLTGNVTTLGSTCNWVSGAQFDEISPGQQITLVGLMYTVASVVSSTLLVLTIVPPTLTNTPYTAAVGADVGGQFNISAPFDGSTWDPLDFAKKESDSSYLQSIAADHEQLYLFGTGDGNSEVWQNTGDPTFPFQRITGAAARLGSVARYSPVAMSNKMFLLAETSGGGPRAYRLDGFNPVAVSTHAEEYAWSSGIDSPSGAIAYAEVHDGHELWVVNFPGALSTWVYDETESQRAGTPIWHQRARWDGANFQSYVPRFHTFIPEWGPAGMHVVCDFASGKFYELSLNYADDDGSDKKWVRILPHIYSAGNWVFYGRMTLEMETGTTSSAVTQPTITRDYSSDRGHTFVSPLSPLTGGAGVNGAYSQRVFWGGTSASRDRVWRLSGSGQYQTTLIDLDVDTEVGGV
jgi:hypothetical protein